MSKDLKQMDPDFRDAYEWLRQQMRARLPDARPAKSLLWAWYQHRGSAHRKPDLRLSGYLPKGTKGVRLEFEADEDNVLLSDFELWHYVLNKWYLPRSESDAERLAAGNPPSQDLTEASWSQIFDLDWSAPPIAAPRRLKSIQATLWNAPTRTVREVTEFTAR